MKSKKQPKQLEKVPAHLRITCQGGEGIRLEAAQDGEDDVEEEMQGDADLQKGGDRWQEDGENDA